MLRYFCERKTKEIFGLEALIYNPLEEDRWPKEIDEEVKERGVDNTIDDLVDSSTLHGSRVNEQLDDAIEALKRPDVSQRAVIVITDGSRDLRKSFRLDDGQRIPVFTAIDFKLSQKVHTIATLRSCEVFVFWTIDALRLARLINSVGQRTGLDIGSLVIFSDRAYIEEDDYVKVEALVKSWRAGTRSF
jgi:thymidylate synthase